jgi:hypothetical protein
MWRAGATVSSLMCVAVPKRDDLRTASRLGSSSIALLGGQMSLSQRQNHLRASVVWRSSWVWPARSPASGGGNAIRKRLGSPLAAAVLSLAAAMIGDRARATVLDAPIGLRMAADELSVMETVQFYWQGRRYCWYEHG